MKQIIYAAFALSVFASCNQGEIAKTNSQKDSLIAVLQTREGEMKEREAAISDFISAFNDVEKNLDSVAARQQILYLHADKKNGDVKDSQKDRINAQISAINDLMNTNRSTIADLQAKLKKSKRSNKKLSETLATLQSQLQQKDAELAALNEKLGQLNAQITMLRTSVDSLTAQNNSHSQTIAENTIAMHTAYYVFGSTKHLREAKVIDRKGGLLGMGKTSQLSTNFDNSKFTRIDYTKTTSIEINGKRVKVITTHPINTYKLETDPKNKNLVTRIIITEPDRFWAASKYLVLEGDPLEQQKALTAGNSDKNKL